MFHAFWEDDLARIRPVGGGLTFFAVLEIVALERYFWDINWGASGAWIYLLFLLSLLPVGLYAWLGPETFRWPRRAPRT
jgi:hypothetical protein